MPPAGEGGVESGNAFFQHAVQADCFHFQLLRRENDGVAEELFGELFYGLCPVLNEGEVTDGVLAQGFLME